MWRVTVGYIDPEKNRQRFILGEYCSDDQKTREDAVKTAQDLLWDDRLDSASCSMWYDVEEIEE
jgi:hypothetical protein